jgi:hypothetical protein
VGASKITQDKNTDQSTDFAVTTPRRGINATILPPTDANKNGECLKESDNELSHQEQQPEMRPNNVNIL